MCKAGQKEYCVKNLMEKLTSQAPIVFDTCQMLEKVIVNQMLSATQPSANDVRHVLVAAGKGRPASAQSFSCLW